MPHLEKSDEVKKGKGQMLVKVGQMLLNSGLQIWRYFTRDLFGVLKYFILMMFLTVLSSSGNL